MKIRKIFIKNIHSLAGENIIDFEKSPLKEAGIIAIVGKTGAGKSTILDAITLALYNQMPRLEKKFTTSYLKNMGSVVTRGKKEAIAQVEYENNGKIYVSSWKYFTSSNNYFMHLQQIYPFKKDIEAEYKSKVPEKNQQIIGLDYQNFLKAVILPQGQFANFLKAKPDDRLLLLEKITDSIIYKKIGSKIYFLHKDLKNKIDEKLNFIENRKKELLTEDQKNIIQQKIKTLNSEQQELKSKLQELNKQAIKLKEILKKQQTLKTLLESQKALENEKIEIEKLNQKLSKHKKLIGYSGDFTRWNSLKNDKNILQDKIQQTKETLSNKQKALKIELKKIKSLEKFRKTFDFIQKHIEPSISEYETLTKDLQIKSEHLKNIDNQHNDTLKEIKKLEKDIHALKKSLSNLIETEEKIKIWLEKNKILEDLTEEFSSYKTYISNYEALKEEVLKKIQSNKNLKNLEKEKIESWQNILENKKQNLEIEFFRIKNSIGNSNPQQINAQIEQIELQIKQWQKAKELSEKIDKDQKQMQESLKEIEQLKSDLEFYRQNITKAENEIKILKAELESLEKKLEVEKLKQKYEKDRLYLKEGEPCPLCGSTVHPFAKNIPQIAVSQTETEINQTKEKLEKATKILEDNQKAKAKKEGKIESLLKSIETTKQEIQLFENQFFKLKISNQILKVAKIEKIISEKEKQKREKLADLSKLEQLRKLEIEKNELQNLIENVKKLNENRKIVQKIWKKYKTYTKNSQTIKDFLVILEDLKNKYSQSKEKINQLANQKTEVRTKLDQNSEHLKKLETEKQEIENQAKKIKNEIENLKEKAQKISFKYFATLTPKDYTNKIQAKEKKLSSKYQKSNEQKTKLETEIKNLEKNFKEWKEKIDETEEKLNQLTKYLEGLVNEMNFSSIEEAFSMILKPEDAISIEEKIKNFTQKETQIKEQINILKKELEAEENKKLLENDLQQIENQVITLEKRSQKILEEISNAKAQLEKNLTLENELSEYLKTYETLKNEFYYVDMLNKLIGDKEGKTFSKYAQQYTLAELIKIANNYLEKLNDRYYLEFSEQKDENIFVIDRFFANKARSVRTLSGGETFLVSLSFALAMSDLASHKTQIKSLFIDEGFGTLDNETLENVLITLEKLQNISDKTICIISHLPALKERITTKIEIQKTSDNSGFSKIVY